MFDTSASSKDRPRRHSVATGTPTKEGKEGKDNDTTGTVPVEQMENWEITRKRVAQAASSILGTSALIAHEILLTSVDLVELAPVPGLQAAARTLLQIWACLQQVDSNRLQCLRLTEHCADILLSVRQEVYEAGDEVEDELRLPFDKLTESFNDVHALLVKQAGRPFLKRYLKRDEISKQLHQCDVGLQEALGMFSISIQIRILKQVSSLETSATSTSICTVTPGATSVESTSTTSAATSTATSTTASHTTTHPIPPALFPSASSLPPTQVLPTLLSLTRHQAALDAESDYADLRGVMRTALSKGSDVEILKVSGLDAGEMAEAIKTLQRAHEAILERERWEDLQARQQEQEDKDTLDKEFIESGIDALRRMSRSTADPARLLPSWTITRYEIDREEKIGVGFFSDVYKGTWHTSPSLSFYSSYSSRVVAIKVLAETTPRSLFLRETAIWKKLSHPNVLELYGASSASGDPPWFFVSPYMRNGCLVEYLRRNSTSIPHTTQGGFWDAKVPWGLILPDVKNSGSGVENVPKEWDLLRFMHEIAKGMEYLHGQGVLHGDLKASFASNVLVDDKIHCVISDFGQSEMRSEAYRISGTALPHGTLRWQAPEIFAGSSQLTVEMDVYAFAICCTEVLSLGRMPWPLYDDNQVQNHIMANQRPEVPPTCFTSPDLIDLIRLCWATNPLNRPLFSEVASELKALRKKSTLSACVIGAEMMDSRFRSPRFSEPLYQLQDSRSLPSPDMYPIQLLPRVQSASTAVTVSPSIASTIKAGVHASSLSTSPFVPPGTLPFSPATASSPSSSAPPPPILPNSSPYPLMPASSLHLPELVTGNKKVNGYDRYDLPPLANDLIAEAQNERRYRLLLVHEFHPSLTLPLWSPAPVALGAVGYLSKPKGEFITLFNAFHPQNSVLNGVKSLPSVHGYGKVSTGNQRQDKRNAAQRSLDTIAGLLTLKGRGGNISKHVSRRYSYPLRVGHKTAHLCTETTMYRYVENLDAPKKWFKANVDTVLEIFGPQHQIQKEDLFFVIGSLDTPEYALFVSHNHPDGQVHFNVFNSSKSPQPWGTFTTDTETPFELGGPSYREPVSCSPICSNKISAQGSYPWNTVLIARLRFKPDVLEPTSL
ncbi:hypothetical protein F5879DRAFT_803026 [Lentinula edodes]|nr:hypothetical protein F5879DRAFT_803026 [Lentinula edodes]